MKFKYIYYKKKKKVNKLNNIFVFVIKNKL